MTHSFGHNGAQGRPLPESGAFSAFEYGLSADAFDKLSRAKEACDLLQLLFAFHPHNDGGVMQSTAPGMAALMEYLRADLIEVTRCCALMEEARV
ncbi:hypothetical protein ERHA54_00640 [Erwinia rhapontici]|uniref:Uncharacterized protein n=1 Tax=Erwinia aphidicola TaxID=68334 RepID=A0ABU8DIE8_ERWAP|nr:hypothetical protein [Erwinia rhapontici]BCQ37461.1 hypothetical protein ERHA54_00640 [Erwinia rhapontici]